MKRATVMILCCFSVAAYASNPTKTWLKIIKTCQPAQTIGSNVLFFGLSNDIGPGSVWRFGSDKALKIKFELSDAIANSTDRDKLINAGALISCTSNSQTDWNLSLGLPFSVTADSISADIGATLQGAKTVKVSITGVATDLLKETPWKIAFAHLPQTNDYVLALKEPDGLLAENAVKVKGLTAVFTYDHALGLDIQAKFKAKAFSVADPGGTSTTAVGSGNSSNNESGSGSAARPASAAASSESSSGSTTASAPASHGASTSDSCPKAPGSDDLAKDAKPKSGGGLTLHVGFQGDRQIVLCADGPFYVLAEYSKLVNSQPVGVAPSSAQIQIRKVTTAFPDDTRFVNERKATSTP